MKKDIDFSLIGRMIFLAILAFLIGYIFYSLNKNESADSSKQVQRITEILKKAAVQCYALEGRYPPDLEYLANYGVVLDEEKYFYLYSLDDISNYMPTIFVAAR